MLVPKKMSTSRSTLMIILILAVFGVSGYLMYNRFAAPDSSTTDLSQSADINVKQLPNISPDFSSDFIDQQPYTNLVQNGQIPVQAGSTGRVNPFVEISFSLFNR